jgi:hypothetical protein
MQSALFLVVAADSNTVRAAGTDTAFVTAVVSLIVAFIALIGSIAGAMVSSANATKAAVAQIASAETSAATALANAKTVAYSATVTSERSKWINALRENIASLSGILRTLSYLSERTEIDKVAQDKLLAEANGLIPLVRLQLNPFGIIETDIAKLLQELPSLATRPNGSDLRQRDDLFVEHCRWLLKAEWEKVKTEASGARTTADEEAYYRRYKEFFGKGSSESRS